MNKNTPLNPLPSVNLKEIFDRAKPFMRLMMEYECALLEIETKISVLNQELSIDSNKNPILSTKARLKDPESIIGKLERRGIPFTIENVETHLNDIAGIRVICAFIDDIYIIADRICKQDDIKVIEKKDYIQFPKENGYRSLHLIVEVPVFFFSETKHIKVEVQLRTIAMDSWASLEHKIRYKKEIGNAENISVDLKECADTLQEVDRKMQDIHYRIEYQSHKNDKQ